MLGDKLHIKAILSERTSVTASADFSGIGLGSDESTECTKNESNWVCEWTTNKIAPKSTNVELKFKFTDFVGNEAEKKVNIKVLGISDEENPNYWKISSIEKMPEHIKDKDEGTRKLFWKEYKECFLAGGGSLSAFYRFKKKSEEKQEKYEPIILDQLEKKTYYGGVGGSHFFCIRGFKPKRI